MKVYSIPESAEKVINEYQHLQIGSKDVVTPYFINPKSQRAGLRVMIGKGDPGEISREVNVLAQLKGIDLKKMTVDQVREFMKDQNIGIDCSGFIVHVLNYWLTQQGDKPLVHYIKFPDNTILSRIKRKLRPVERIGANLMTNSENTELVQIKNVRPGDFIRSKGPRRNAHHISLVSEVTEINGNVTEIEYVHSINGYGDENGVRFGKILINDQNDELKNQVWTEVSDERNWTYEGLMKDYEDNGLRRLKRVKLKYHTRDE